MTLEQIRRDLRNIRYYYSRKENFDEFKDVVGENKIITTIKEYNDVVKNAPPRLFDLYINLYVKNNTQENLSEQLHCTAEYIQILNKKLLVFLQKSFEELGK